MDLKDCELSVALVGDEEIRNLNGRYRSRDEPTDVLSFPVEEPLPTGHRLIGDVIISVEKAARQARQRRRSFEDEMEVLLIHGILHNLGYDHERSPRGRAGDARHGAAAAQGAQGRRAISSYAGRIQAASRLY